MDSTSEISEAAFSKDEGASEAKTDKLDDSPEEVNPIAKVISSFITDVESIRSGASVSSFMLSGLSQIQGLRFKKILDGNEKNWRASISNSTRQARPEEQAGGGF